QRAFAADHDVVMEGRDIGTVVFPYADRKFFLVADLDVRAERRAKESPDHLSIEAVKQDLLRRDEHDASRSHSPLRKAEDAIEIDTTNLTFDQQVNKILSCIKEPKNGGKLMAEELKNVEPVNPQEDIEAVPGTEEVQTEDVQEDLVEETKEAEAEVTDDAEVAEEPAEEVAEEKEEAAAVEEEVAEVEAEATVSEEPKTLKPAAEADKKRAGNIYDQIRTVKREDLAAEAASQINPELEKMYEKTLNKFSSNERVNGHVIRITDKEVVVDIGFKSEGLISVEEFGKNIPELGDEIEIFVDKIEDRKGQLILSKKKADFLRAWERLKEVFEGDGIIEGYIVKRIKGGMVVDLGGVEGFLPGSQIDVRPVIDFDAYVGKNMNLKIVKLNEARKNIVVSRKEILEEALKEKREELLSQIQVDQVLKGRVKNITDFGAFIDLGGVDGLLHITDMSWGRIKHPSELLSIDDIVEVKVIDYNTEKQRVSLGVKQLEAHPWEDIEQKYPLDSVVKGRIVSITNYGVFVELEKGVEGLIHISEMSWTQHIKHPSEIYQINDEVEAKVLAIDSHDRKISLGVKQLQPDPWDELEKKYSPGMKVKGIVRNLTQFGAFVEIEEGIDGLIHVSDLSWIKVVRHPKEVLQKGQEIDVVILEINNESRKISLGYKQLEVNPWEVLEAKYKTNKMVKAKVLKILDKGIIMTIDEEEVEAIVPLSTMSKKDKRDYTRDIKVGDELELRVVEVRQDDRKIVLAYEDLGLSEDDKDIARVIAKQEDVTQKIQISDELMSKFRSKEAKSESKETKAAAEAEKSEAEPEEPKAKKAKAAPEAETEESKAEAPKKVARKKTVKETEPKATEEEAEAEAETAAEEDAQ
ncbi:MAG: 30S ribosomal protein S1, partial [Candidatus Marinimicrobia bacterium]|nr:30S ribosomal protein S1 [Candidatus Neomarinimicrobiota bacterium]